MLAQILLQFTALRASSQSPPMASSPGAAPFGLKGASFEFR
jgi:hypothetical protein